MKLFSRKKTAELHSSAMDKIQDIIFHERKPSWPVHSYVNKTTLLAVSFHYYFSLLQLHFMQTQLCFYHLNTHIYICMCMYMHVDVYVQCVCINICICMYVNVYVYIRVHVSMYVYMCIRVHCRLPFLLSNGCIFISSDELFLLCNVLNTTITNINLIGFLPFD